MHRCWIPLVGALCVGATPLVAQTPQPPGLKLPAGVRARVVTVGPLGQVEGTLVSADSDAITIRPAGAHPLVAGDLTVPMRDVMRFEMALEKRRHALRGLLIGVAAGALFGLVDEVDPVTCETSDYIACTRAEAVGVDAAGFGLLGLGIGALIQTDRWTPVAIDTLAPPVPRALTRNQGRLGLQFTVRF